VHSASLEHADATDLLRDIYPGGRDAAKKLGRLLAYKHDVNYGLESLSGKRLADMQNWAAALVAFAEDVVGR
jgi:hypothetical protein